MKYAVFVFELFLSLNFYRITPQKACKAAGEYAIIKIEKSARKIKFLKNFPKTVSKKVGRAVIIVQGGGNACGKENGRIE